MKQTLLKVVTLLVSVNQIYGGVALKKFKPGDYQTGFIETPIRYIIINRDKCDEGLSCDNVAYYEINKKTGKTFKIARGETINIKPSQGFRGYSFNTKEKDKELFYNLRLIGGRELFITDTEKTYHDERLREY